MTRLEKTAQLVGYSSLERYAMKARFLFDGIQIKDKDVLDIGCGKGAWLLWAVQHGAKFSVGIEPEIEGSTKGTLSALNSAIIELGLDGTWISGCKLYDLPYGNFDIAILHNVINHLDERNVQLLHNNSAAVRLYADMIMRDLFSRLKNGAWVIVADCMRTNFWNMIGLESPLARGIEWHKHQNPGIWRDVFTQAGFNFVDLRWSPLQPFPRITSNRLVQFLTSSHFVMRFQKP